MGVVELSGRGRRGRWLGTLWGSWCQAGGREGVACSQSISQTGSRKRATFVYGVSLGWTGTVDTNRHLLPAWLARLHLARGPVNQQTAWHMRLGIGEGGECMDCPGFDGCWRAGPKLEERLSLFIGPRCKHRRPTSTSSQLAASDA